MVAALCAIASANRQAAASDVVEVGPLSDRIVLIHFDDGHVEHHRRREPRSHEKVVVSPLNVDLASRPLTFRIKAAGDPSYSRGRAPTGIGRKSKGTDFAWFVDRWVNDHAENDRPDHAKEHWLYVKLPSPLRRNVEYTIETGRLAANGQQWKVRFDESKSRSEAVHVNLLGYVPSALHKYAYVSQWMGDLGGLDLSPYEGKTFRLVDPKTGKPAFTGKLARRALASQQETYHTIDSPPLGNFAGADVYECDFSAFRQPGIYVVAVDGIGCSFPFQVADDVYREAFRTVARGLYHNRSGIELKEPYTRFTRAAPLNPRLTPGFAGKLVYTAVRFTDWGSEGGDAKALLAGVKGPVESAGWYQDAGDWDSYYSHLRIAQELLLVFGLVPEHFRDGELNIPESGNGIPDIVDEAAWLPRYLYHQRHELIDKKYGTGGVGLRIAGDAFGSDEGTRSDGSKFGRGSWEDTDRTWVVSGEDPWSTYRYAGVAAELAFALERLHAADPGKIDWRREAVESYEWARKNTRSGDESVKEPQLREPRAYAAAALFRLTGEKAYETQFLADATDIGPTTLIWSDARFGPMLYALIPATGRKARPQGEAYARIRSALLATADHSAIETAGKRAMRWAGNWYVPMFVGHQTTPSVLEAIVGYWLTRESQPSRAGKYLASIYTSCDYVLGCNPLNMAWVTGLGVRHPQHVFHMDAWYNGKAEFHPGIIPYGPTRTLKEQGQGPWDASWPNKTVYPKIDAWPGAERWFDNRCCPLSSEFTVHQNTGPAAAAFGFLCGPATEAKPGSSSRSANTSPSDQRDEALARAQASVKAASERLKNDRNRPIYHLLPPAYWNNDPNGPVYFQGKYHLFYQHNPYGDTWGNMHWGHFRSNDLVHWEDLPIALWPSKDKGEDHVFSGCAAVTDKNRLMLIYTSIGQRLPEQWAAIPEDNELFKWKKHPANPILTESLHGNTKVFEWRDPFAFTASGQTYLVCGGNLNEGRGGGAVVNVYRAENGELTAWNYLGVLFQHPDRDVKNIECPLFFPIGNQWVLVVSQGRPVQYFVGDLDADTMRFKPRHRGIMDYGNYYAPNSLLDGKGRRILWGWVPDFPQGKGWNGCLTLPRVLTVEADGVLGQVPAPELAQLRGRRFVMSDVALEGERMLEMTRGDALEIKLVVDLHSAREAGVKLRSSSDGRAAVSVAFDRQRLLVSDVDVPLAPAVAAKPLEIRIFLDRSVLEVYVGNQICVTRVIQARPEQDGVAIWARGGTAKVKSLESWPMSTIWAAGSRY